MQKSQYGQRGLDLRDASEFQTVDYYIIYHSVGDQNLPNLFFGSFRRKDADSSGADHAACPQTLVVKSPSLVIKLLKYQQPRFFLNSNSLAIEACKGMTKQLPRRPAAFTLSVADAFFFEELRATLSYAEAAQWLAEHVKGRSGPRSSPCSASPLCSPRRPHSLPLSPRDAPLPRDVSAVSVEAYMSKLSPELEADRGLLYTDAAHMVLDVLPRSPQKAVNIEAGLCGGDKGQKWSSSFQVQAGCESPRSRDSVETAARRAQPKLSSSLEASKASPSDQCGRVDIASCVSLDERKQFPLNQALCMCRRHCCSGVCL